jgi:hypothetical protein
LEVDFRQGCANSVFRPRHLVLHRRGHYFFTHLHTMPLVKNILVNTSHILIFIAAFWIATHVSQPNKEA